MLTRYGRITTTIEREWLAEIIAGTKKIEYRSGNSRSHQNSALGLGCFLP
jgi:hypothetical protein